MRQITYAVIVQEKLERKKEENLIIILYNKEKEN